MTNQVIFTNARLVLEDEVISGTIICRNGKICEISEKNTNAAEAIDAEQDYIIPGLVELHTDNLERHMEPRPRINWPLENAIIAHDSELASVGITTVFDALRTGTVPSGKDNYLQYAKQVAESIEALVTRDDLKISHLIHLRAEVCSETLVEELETFKDMSLVRLISIMDHTPGQRQFRNLEKFKSYIIGKNKLNEEQYNFHFEKLLEVKEKYGRVNLEAAIASANLFGALKASHDDTTVEHVRNSKNLGISLAEFPTTKEAAVECKNFGILTILGAPNLMRGLSHSGNVSAIELAEMDLIDIISSDYIPSALFLSAFKLGSIWDNLAAGIKTVTLNPARALGLLDRGALKEKLRADFCRIATHKNILKVRETYVKGQRVA